MRKHRDAVGEINPKFVPSDLYGPSKQAWDEAVELGDDFGYRNAQATVLAPTGTIGFMMDCDTTGVEPDIALVKYKKLVGGGLMKIVNGTVPMALAKLGYTQPEVEAIIYYIDEQETIEGAPVPQGGTPAGVRLRVQASARGAVDPLHGPHPDDGRHAAVYLGRDQQDRERPARGDRRGSREGISRVVATGREGDLHLSRRQQADAAAQHVAGPALATRATPPEAAWWAGGVDLQARSNEIVHEVGKIVERPTRRKLPDERHSITHKFDIAGHEGYITVGLFPDGTPGEIFLTMAKEGSTISGFADAFAQAVSYALQYGVPLPVLVDNFSHARFEPSGMTKNPEVRFAKSIVDYIFRWMATKFLSPEAQFRAGVNLREEPANGDQGSTDEARVSGAGGGQSSVEPKAAPGTSEFAAIQNQEDAPPCSTCGSLMIRSGSCYKCTNCGTTSGCA